MTIVSVNDITVRKALVDTLRKEAAAIADETRAEAYEISTDLTGQGDMFVEEQRLSVTYVSPVRRAEIVRAEASQDVNLQEWAAEWRQLLAERSERVAMAVAQIADEIELGAREIISLDIDMQDTILSAAEVEQMTGRRPSSMMIHGYVSGMTIEIRRSPK
jgi:hypothetical protein